MTIVSKQSRSYRLYLQLFGAVIILVVMCTAVPVHGQVAMHHDIPLLTALGEAEIRVMPDLAEVRVGVETEAATATEARAENAALVTAVVEAIRALNIPEQDIQTAMFQIQPVRRFEDQPPRGQQPPIVGYRVVNVINVRTAQFDLVPRIIDESVRAGANRIDGVSFRLLDEAEAQRQALQAASADAQQNAGAMAAQLDVELVEIHSIQQGGIGVIPPPVVFRGLALEAAATPVFPGEVSVNAQVTLSYVIR